MSTTSKINSNIIKRPPLNSIITSIAKLKILVLLSNYGELNITAIAKKTGLNHGRIKSQLEELQKQKIVIEKRFGRVKIFKINDNSEPAYKIKKFFQGWNNEI